MDEFQHIEREPKENVQDLTDIQKEIEKKRAEA